MRSKLPYLLTQLLALVAAVLLPWLAYREAQHQALGIEADRAAGAARDALHRSDATGKQVLASLAQLKDAGFAPCSPEALRLVREIDLRNTYVEAVGYVRNGELICSSLGEQAQPLGAASFHSAAGLTIYLDLPLGSQAHTSLMAVQQGQVAALSNRAAPLDTWSATHGASLAIMHLERPRAARPPTARGYVDPRWLQRAAAGRETAFVDGGYLVAVARSASFPTAAIAAVPLARVDAQAHAIAWRLVPAGLAASTLIAAILVLLARRRNSVPAALREALRKNEFFLVYQPLVDVLSGEWIGAEALMRLRRGSGDMIGPDLFIPIAEECGLIGRLTERVLELVERDAGTFLAAHPDFHIAVNVAASDLRSNALLAMIERFLASTGARPSNLMVEITERAFVDPAIARAAIDGLRARGIAVAIDDFGTGYSSLSHLESLKLDLLKIDRSFVESIGTAAPTSQVVEHIIAMARTIGLRMIAEGIETEEQAAFVRARGVEYAQGWLFGRPMPFVDFEQLFQKRSVSRK